jgi:hypothetical protein
MEIKKYLFLFAIFFCSSCSVYDPAYVPGAESLTESVHGSYLVLESKDGNHISGELIAVDSSGVVLLSSREKKCVTVPRNSIAWYSLHYAKAKNYSWTIPVYSLFTLSHGIFLVFTLPLNLITTSSITNGGIRSYRYTKKNFTLDQMKDFARFPQGIPAGVSVGEIR